MHNARWSHGKYVLIGDALHTAHFSIGSGTRLAMEDAIALDKALGAASATMCRRRLPASKRRAGRSWKRSSPAPMAARAWYENFAEHMELAPADFAMSYITRSGRVDIERLRKLSPRFVERYERRSGA